MDDRIALWLAGLAAVTVAFALMWGVQRATEDASLVDATWAFSLGLLALQYAWRGDGFGPRRIAMAALAGAWAARLSAHIVRRHRRSGEEDPRYREIRQRRSGSAQGFFFLFYQAQALLAAVLSVPFLVLAFDPAPRFRAVEVAGALLAAAALLGEWIADRQLARHRADPANRGRTCRSGLWRYSRHPNYFFEWLVWCGVGLAAIGAPYGYLGLVSPLIMVYLIVRVTGIPPAEARALRSRGDDYRKYQETTSAFVPWFPREEATT